MAWCPILMLLFLSAASACTISTPVTDLDHLMVPVPGGESFQIGVRGLSTVTQLIPGSDVAWTTVQRPLRFIASQPVESMPVHLTRDLALASGRIEVKAGLPLRVEPDGSTLPPVVLSLHELHTPLRLPCSDLEVTQRRVAEPHLKRSTDRRATSRLRGTVPVYVGPHGEGDPLAVRFSGDLLAVERQPDWVKVRAEWSDGSLFSGWVHDDDVQVGMHLLGLRSLHANQFGGRCRHGLSTRHQTRILPPGTSIHEGVEGYIWATVTEPLEVVTTDEVREDGWIRVVHVDGLPTPRCREHQRLWVDGGALGGG